MLKKNYTIKYKKKHNLDGQMLLHFNIKIEKHNTIQLYIFGLQK